MIQKAKRKLALLLAAVMLVGLLPTAAFAAGGEEPSGGAQITEPSDGTSTTTPPVETQPGGEDDTVPPTETQPGGGDDTVPPTETQPGGGDDTVPPTETQPAEPEVVPVALSYDDLLLSTVSQDQPFSPGTLNSNTFRIPALVTLNDGTLVAAADARWGTYADGQNTDTMVAVSSDNGQSWTTSLVNYFADTADVQQSGAASFIDPALATDGQTVYMLVDVFPGGVDGLSDCGEGTGYDSSGNLKLKMSGEDDYNYYVGKFNESGYAPVMSYSGETTSFAVDAHYNLYSVDGDIYTAVWYRDDTSYGDGAYVPANVFYQNATFTVSPTSYLWLVKSTDYGQTWSAPQILNADVKSDRESFYGVGPGRGLVASNGTIYFSCYKYGLMGQYSQQSSLIYSTDGGETWGRTDDLSNAGGGLTALWSSENQAVELNDGTIRMFYRNGRGVVCYVDLEDNGTSWGSPVSLENTMADIGNRYIRSDCQLSVIHYSQTIDGKEALLVSCPSSKDSRTNGKIFVFTLDENNSMTCAYSYEVTASGEHFAYSCLTELSDGSIGILYENGGASITYKTIAMDAIAPGAVIGGVEESDPIKATDGTLLDGAPFSLKVNGQPRTVSVALAEGKTLSAQSSDTGVVTAGVNGSVVTLTPVAAGSTTVTLTVSTLSRAAGDTATATLNVTVTDGETTDMGEVNLIVGGEAERTISNVDLSDAPISYDPEGFATVAVRTEEHSTSGETYRVLTGTASSITSGGQYVISSGNQVLATSGANLTYAAMPAADTPLNSSVLWTITPSGSGYTISQEIDGRTYYLGYERHEGGDWFSGYTYTYSPTLTTSSSIWTFSNRQFYQYLESSREGIWGGSNRSTNFYLNYNYNGSGWEMTTAESSVILNTTEEKTNPGTTYIDSILTFTGVAAGVTTVTIGNYQYTVNVAEQPPFNPDDYTIISNTGDPDNYGNYYSRGHEVEHLILTPGMHYDLDLNGNYSSVSWSSNDTSVATVGSSNGTVSAESPGIATITANITTPDGNQGVKTVYVTVLDAIDAGGRHDASRTVEIYVNELRDSRLYYHQNRESNPYLVEVQEHTVFYISTEGLWAMTFFGAPVNDNYAMTYMSAANNQSQTNWYVIEDNVSATSTTFYENRGSLGGTYGYDRSDLTTMINSAKAQGADGGFWFTRASDGANICQAIINVVSEPLPTVKKEITSVTHNGQSTPYADGMAIYAGDTINYNIAVTTYGSEYGITYSNPTLTETLAPFTDGEMSKRISLTDRDNTQTFAASYTVKSTDIGKDLTNKVSFAYSYKAKYSTGSMTASAEAAASITVLPFTPKNYVVDFGLPVTFDFSDQITEAMGNITFNGATSSQGATVSASGKTVNYQLTKPLTGPDTVTVNLTSGGTMNFKVYPATTVYYDGSFVEGLDVTSTGMQTASAVGSKDRYGYQDNYTTAAFGTLPSTGTVEFSFTGTGVDVYANTTNDSCYVAVWLYSGTGDNKSLEGLYLVDTAMKAGKSGYTTVPNGTSYNVPIVSLTDLTHGTYTVEIQRIDPQKGESGRKNVDLSGFRVYGTLADGNSIYAQDGEANPTFTEVRNSVLETLGRTLTEALTNQFEQVYDKFGANISAVIEGLENTTGAADDFLLRGPKNEVYLTGGQSLTITVPAGGTYQLGLKSLNASNAKVTVNDRDVDVTNVDMFYEVSAPSGTITISNPSGYISVSMLKSFGTTGN